MGGDAHWVKQVELLLTLTQVPLQVVSETLVALRPEDGPSFPVGPFPCPLCWAALPKTSRPKAVPATDSSNVWRIEL